MTRDDVPRLPRGVRLHFDAVRHAHVLLAPERAFNVNKTAVAVLQLVDGQRSVGEIVAALEREIKDTPPTLERDVIAMLDDLAAKRVMER